MNKELKPCPFCGSAEDVVFIPSNLNAFGMEAKPGVGCKKCNYTIYGDVYMIPGDEKNSLEYSDNLLRNWWNRRNGEK